LVDLISLDDRILFVLLSVSKGHMTQVMWRPISSQIYTGRPQQAVVPGGHVNFSALVVLYKWMILGKELQQL